MRRSNATRTALLAAVVAVGGLCAPTAWAANPEFSGQVNIYGATLFRPFFDAPASTNDHIDVDDDGRSGFNETGAGGWYIDQLAPDAWSTGYWQVQYRGVGSGNGLAELVTHYDGMVYDEEKEYYLEMASEVAMINRQVFWDGESLSAPPGNPANAAYGYTPVIPDRIDVAVMDVPTTWFVQNTTGAGSWSANPASAGYGTNSTVAWNASQVNLLKSLGDLNTDGGDGSSADRARQVFDTPVAWVPICFIANRGTGIYSEAGQEGKVKMSQLQHLFVTGRMPSGENLIAATRDSGSGTRNGSMNSIDVDPSWGRGDNLGKKLKVKSGTNLGYTWDPESGAWLVHQASNLGGSSIMEEAVKNHGLAVGYDGLAGSSRAARDSENGLYEILDVRKDTAGGTEYVRPSLTAMLDNADVNTGWQIGGPETMATVGDPQATPVNDLPAAAGHESNPEMRSKAAASYIRNILESIQRFEGSPPGEENWNMPGEFMANTFVLMAGIDAVPNPLDPANFIVNTDLNPTVQAFIRANHDLASYPVPTFGASGPANLVPNRGVLDRDGDGQSDMDLDGDGTVDVEQYSDGSVNGDYRYIAGGQTYSVQDGIKLNARNRIMGDFLYDNHRNINDIERMMLAVDDPETFMQRGDEGDVAGDKGDLAHNVVIPEIIGDFNGDGSFDANDVRYFADGLAMDPASGRLNRVAGFTRVDTYAQGDGAGNYFGTTLATESHPAISYAAGDSRGDVAGSATGTSPGALPTGADGAVDAADIDYLAACYRGDGPVTIPGDKAAVVGSALADGKWDFANLHEAVYMDLSCDMDADLDLDLADLSVLITGILKTQFGDITLDAEVGIADLVALAEHYGQNGGWSQGDITFDGVVGIADLSALADKYGWSAGGANVPEPTTLSLLAFASLAPVVRRRRTT